MVTITAFSVVIPFLVGLILIKRVPSTLIPVIILCGVWFAAECINYYMRINGLENTLMWYALTPIEIFLFTSFFLRLLRGGKHKESVGWTITAGGIALVMFDYFIIGGSVNTFSLAVELSLITCFSVFIYFNSDQHGTLILTLFFYTLSSFPYFFAYEWLRVSNMEHLRFLAGVYAYTHSACYLIIAYSIWKSSLSYSVPSSSQL